MIATKFGGGPLDGTARGSGQYIRSALARSLERLQTDYINLYFYHAPDGVTPVAETLGALDELVERGVVRAIGCSYLDATQLKEAELLRARRGALPSCLDELYGVTRVEAAQANHEFDELSAVEAGVE